MTAPSETVAARLDARYGRRRRRRLDRGLGWLLAGIGVALLLLTFVFAWTTVSTQDIEATDIDHRVVGPQLVEITTEVNAKPQSRVACAVEVLSGSHAPIGFKIVDLQPTEKRTQRFTTRVRTAGQPATVHTKECWVVTR